VVQEAKAVLSRDPGVAAKWLKMFNRYNRNCETGYSDTLSRYE
jgi:hypothetical protein